MLARSSQAPEGVLAECDSERAGIGVTAKPRAQESRRARRDDCIARTIRKPDRTKLPAVAALLLSSDLRLFVRHGLSCLAAASGRLLHPGDAGAELLKAGGIRRATASVRVGLPLGLGSSVGLGRPRDRFAWMGVASQATQTRSGAIASTARARLGA